jgi:hypothetical protein
MMTVPERRAGCWHFSFTLETTKMFTYRYTHKCMVGSVGIRSKIRIVPCLALPRVAVSAMSGLFPILAGCLTFS